MVIKNMNLEVGKLTIEGRFLFILVLLWKRKNVLKFKDYNLNYGKGEIIGEAILTGCIPVTDEFENSLYKINSLVYGKSDHPRVYAWKLENIIMYEKRILCKGKLGLWNYDISN